MEESAAGTGPAPLPAGVDGWSWGAFLLNGAWAIRNRTWRGTWALLPLAGIPMWFVLGFKGRAWAWRAGQWKSLEHFNRVQRRWSIWGIATYLICALLPLIWEVAGYWFD